MKDPRKRHIYKVIDKIIAERDCDFSSIYKENDLEEPCFSIANYATMDISSFSSLNLKEVLKEQDLQGHSILHYAAKFGNIELVQYLLENNVDPDIKNVDKETPIRFAVEENHQDIVRILLEVGADRDNPKEYSGDTTLILAVAEGHKEIVKMLLDAGADPNGASKEYNLFDMTENKEIKDLLIEYGCIESLESYYETKALGRIPLLLNIKHHTIQEKCMDEPTIPHKIHYIWLTNERNPKEAPQTHLKYVIDSMEAFRNGTQYKDWQYRFHTNAPYSINNTTSFFKSLGFEILDIKDGYGHFITNSFLENFIQHKKYGLAADLARYEVLNKEGGVYLDLNFNLTRALDYEFCRYSYVNFDFDRSEAGMMRFPKPENYFFISEPGHNVLIHSINDIYSAFSGDRAATHWKNLNTTNRQLTDYLFFQFSINNILYLNSKSHPGIIYNFREKYVSRKDFGGCAIEEMELLRKIRGLIEDPDQIHSNGLCTNTDLIPPIGEDGTHGATWQ